MFSRSLLLLIEWAYFERDSRDGQAGTRARRPRPVVVGVPVIIEAHGDGGGGGGGRRVEQHQRV
eukprot:6196299-Pleurochrysis_carterae.AAC.2